MLLQMQSPKVLHIHFLTAHLLVKPVPLDDRGTRVPPDGVGPLPKVVDFLGGPGGLRTRCRSIMGSVH